MPIQERKLIVIDGCSETRRRKTPNGCDELLIAIGGTTIGEGVAMMGETDTGAGSTVPMDTGGVLWRPKKCPKGHHIWTCAVCTGGGVTQVALTNGTVTEAGATAWLWKK